MVGSIKDNCILIAASVFNFLLKLVVVSVEASEENLNMG